MNWFKRISQEIHSDEPRPAIQSYQDLITKLLANGNLSEIEWNELSRLEQTLDKEDEQFYQPMKQKLRDIITKIRIRNNSL